MASPVVTELVIRQAKPSDVDAMAEMHRDSIRVIGPAFYLPDAVAAWQADITGGLYLEAMDRGEVFVIATARVDGEPLVCGFASNYCIEGTTYGTSVYVRGRLARRGIGTALLETAEADAATRGATSIEIEASLAAVEFYKVHGYVELRHGVTRLPSGHPIATVSMRKSVPDCGPRARPPFVPPTSGS